MGDARSVVESGDFWDFWGFLADVWGFYADVLAKSRDFREFSGIFGDFVLKKGFPAYY